MTVAGPPSLRAILRELRALSGTAAGPFSDAGAGSPPSPAAVLARLVDFAGSVALASTLAELERFGEGAPPMGVGAPGADRLVETTTARLDAIERSAHDALGEALWGALSPLAPAPFARTWREPDVDLRELAYGLAARLGVATVRAAARARAHLRGLRDELGPTVRALSVAAFRLEHLDGILESLTDGRRREAIGRVVPAASRPVEEALVRLFSVSARDTTTPCPRPLDDRAVRTALERLRDAGRSIVRHDRMLVEALVRAAAGAESV